MIKTNSLFYSSPLVDTLGFLDTPIFVSVSVSVKETHIRD